MNPFALTNKVALITGAASGIGESIARVFAEAKADIRLIDINEEGGLKVARDIVDKGGAATFYKGNVTNQSKMIEISDEIVRDAGHIDILVGNAGISQIGTIEETSEDDIDKIFTVNVKGIYNIMYAVLPHMKNRNSGVILNLASVASTLGLPVRFGYSMSKGAVLSMTYTVARDYLKYNIRCNCIAPGRVHTPFVDAFLAEHYPGQEKLMYDKLAKTQPIGRMGTPEEIAYLALYLCSEKAGFITGSNIPIDGGFVTLNT